MVTLLRRLLGSHLMMNLVRVSGSPELFVIVHVTELLEAPEYTNFTVSLLQMFTFVVTDCGRL